MMKRCFLIVLLMLFTAISVTAQDTVTHDDYELGWEDMGSRESTAAWGRIIDAHPDWAEGYIGRAKGYFYISRSRRSSRDTVLTSLEAALADIEMAIELTGGDYYLWVEKGRLLLSLQRMDEAEASFLQAIEFYPRGGAAYRWLIIMYRDAERHEDAIALYRHFLYLPEEVDTGFHYSDRSQSYAYLNEEANQTFNQLIADGLEHSHYFDYEAAIEDFEAALEFAQQSDGVDEHDEALVQYLIAEEHRWILYLDGETVYSEAAENALREAIRLVPDWDLPYVILSRLYQAIDDSETAIEILDDALLQLPDSPELYKERARYHTDRDAVDVAADLWTYLQLIHQHTFDAQPLDMVNNTTRTTFINGWHFVIHIAAETNDSLFVTFDGEEGDFVLVVLDDQQQPVTSLFYEKSIWFSEPQPLMLDWRVPADGNYTLVIVYDELMSEPISSTGNVRIEME
jgi:tetratricopeptide (TPR) repeat protein